MPAASNKKTTRKLVGGLVVIAFIVCGAGMHHQQKQRDATVNWHHVSTALMDVESAKRELHQSLQQRIVNEQRGVSEPELAAARQQ